MLKTGGSNPLVRDIPMDYGPKGFASKAADSRTNLEAYTLHLGNCFSCVSSATSKTSQAGSASSFSITYNCDLTFNIPKRDIQSCPLIVFTGGPTYP